MVGRSRRKTKKCGPGVRSPVRTVKTVCVVGEKIYLTCIASMYFVNA